MEKEQVVDTDGKTLTKITCMNGDVEYRNTKCRLQLHRIGGPARILSKGTLEYWVNGKRHRIGGPAVTYSNGIRKYCVDGIYYTEKDYPQAVLKYKLKQLVG
jgi:hypothetical protein